MASFWNIFVEGNLTLEELVEKLKGMLDITQEGYFPEREMPYNLYEEHTDLLIGENTFFNSDDINFEDFHYEIDLRGILFHDSAERSHWGYERAVYLFERLKEAGQYRLMLTFDVQAKEEEFIPPHLQQPPSDRSLKAQQLPEGVRIYATIASATTDQSLFGFASQVGQLLKASLEERTGTGNVIWYRLNDGNALFGIRETTTPGSFIINIEGRVYIPGERRYWQFESARNLYQQLKATGTYALRLTDDEKHILEKYVPPQKELL